MKNSETNLLQNYLSPQAYRLLQVERLRRLAKQKEIPPFEPLDWQQEPYADKSPIILLTGSAGGGKSRIAAEKVHNYLKTYPGSTGLMLRKAREYAGKSIVPFMEKTVIAGDPSVKKRATYSMFQYDNGSTLYWAGMKNDEQREGIRSMGKDGSFDIVWMEEANAFTENDFNEILARMRGRAADYNQVILSTNPDRPTHFIYKRLIEGGEAKVYYSGALDNPFNPPHYVETLDKLTGVLRLRLVEGKWVQAEGAVYDEFDPDIHVIDPFDIPEDWRRFRSIDFGYTNPFVCQWWAMDPDGRLYLYREIYKTLQLVEDHAIIIAKESENEYIELTVADHDAEDRATLHKRGIETIPAIKEITTGIQAVKSRLAKAGDGKPRIYFMRGATIEEDYKLDKKPKGTIEEFPGYIWPKTSAGKAAKEVPIKEDDHGMDATRYMVMQFDGSAVGRLLMSDEEYTNE